MVKNLDVKVYSGMSNYVRRWVLYRLISDAHA